MDLKTKEILKIIRSHSLIKRFLTIFCYLLIFFSISLYIFYAFNQKTKNIRLINDYKKNIKKYEVEKIMTNPQIKFEYSDSKIYEITAKKALDCDHNQEYILYDVLVKSEIGNITAGELEISENGERLIFSKNPVLIINSL
jgi:hypothetical protein